MKTARVVVSNSSWASITGTPGEVKGKTNINIKRRIIALPLAPDHANRAITPRFIKVTENTNMLATAKAPSANTACTTTTTTPTPQQDIGYSLIATPLTSSYVKV